LGLPSRVPPASPRFPFHVRQFLRACPFLAWPCLCKLGFAPSLRLFATPFLLNPPPAREYAMAKSTFLRQTSRTCCRSRRDGSIRPRRFQGSCCRALA